MTSSAAQDAGMNETNTHATTEITTDTSDTTTLAGDRRDLLEALTAHRGFLRRTAAGLTDEQASMTPTVSSLCIGGIIKHVAETERSWAAFARDGQAPWADADVDWSNPTPEQVDAYLDGFRMHPGETLADVLEHYERVAAETDALVATLPDLDVAYPLPPAPWFAPGSTRTPRRTFMHIVAETAQHAGHADIIRETIDGAKTMG
jgi:hypothetical protein